MWKIIELQLKILINRESLILISVLGGIKFWWNPAVLYEYSKKKNTGAMNVNGSVQFSQVSSFSAIYSDDVW